MLTEDVRARTRREWRELGFFYNRNDESKVRRFVGSRSGLMRFHEALLEYADGSSNDYESEHEHYGPHSLEIMTWHQPGMDDHAIRGSLADLKRLATIFVNKLAVALVGDSVCIQDEYAANSPYALILEVREDDFDPAKADPMLANES
jgi:hypothetical protein